MQLDMQVGVGRDGGGYAGDLNGGVGGGMDR